MALKGPTTDHGEILAWAQANGIVPVNVEPNRIDAEPASMGLLFKETANTSDKVKELSWDDFFERFDLLGLTLVYDDRTVFNELLQIDDKTTTIPPAYRKVTSHH